MSREGVPNLPVTLSPNERFQEQFETREYIEVPGGSIEMLEVTPEHPKSSVPVLFLSGSHNAPESYEATIKGMYMHGRRVVTLTHPRTEDMPEWTPTRSRALLEENLDQRGNLRETELRKVSNVEHVVTEKHLGQVDIVAHSEGALHTIIFTLEHPEQVRNIVLVAPAGLEGYESMLEVGMRIGLGILGDKLQELSFALFKQGPYREPPNPLSQRAIEKRKRYIAENPARWSQEKRDMTNFQVDSVLNELRTTYGIHISIIQGVHDTPVSSTKMALQLKQGSVDGFYTTGGNLPGKHKDIIHYGEQMSWLIDHALTALEQLEHKDIQESDAAV